MYSELTYVAKDKLEFTNGKCLVYQGKKSFLISLRRFLPYYTSIGAIGALIYFNPCI